ncbi:MAG: methyltransferase [Gammaproteobacteria bacterium]|nr:methyltransferase [Gammaproteobacteria bacterium]
MSKEYFGRDYYQRFYRNARSSVTSQAEMTARANLIVSYVKHIDCPVGSILDAGCGLGLMRTALLRGLPGATYVGLEYSEYLCQKYGWLNGSIADYRPRQPFDLVVCYDVLQYLDDASAAKAIRNFANLCRGVLFFSALTRRDWRENADQRRTDPAVTMRTAEWYRSRLRRQFRHIGAGFWIRRGAPLVAWELESA